MPVITNILAGILTFIVTKVAWERLVLRVLINLIRWAETSASNPSVKSILDTVADELEAAVSGKAPTPDVLDK